MSDASKNFWTNQAEREFMEQLSLTKTGEYLAYHRGSHCGGPLRSLVSRLYAAGAAVPVTKKHGPYDYEYLVAKTTRRNK